MNLRPILADSLMITGFVFVMMVLVEYAQVATAGVLGRWLQRGGVFRTAAVALVGTAPGCLGAFTDVTLYTHGMITFGAISGAMIAASGDEAFVMLALFPGRALLLFGLLFAYGLLVALLVDRMLGARLYHGACCPDGITLHAAELPHGFGILWRRSFADLSVRRAGLTAALALFIAGVALGWIGPERWGWVRVMLLLATAFGLFVTLTVPEHFLAEHLWAHVAKRHVPRIFAWVFGVLLVLAWLQSAEVPLASWIKAHPAWALLAAVFVGLIPESGPHLVFVTLFAQGALPFSVLVASSVVQDGHGMLPLLAESPAEFAKVKAVNFFAGLALGGAMMAVGW
jgi:hypothetical protein